MEHLELFFFHQKKLEFEVGQLVAHKNPENSAISWQ